MVGNVLSLPQSAPMGPPPQEAETLMASSTTTAAAHDLRVCYTLVLSLRTFPRTLLILQQSHFRDEEIEAQTSELWLPDNTLSSPLCHTAKPSLKKLHQLPDPNAVRTKAPVEVLPGHWDPHVWSTTQRASACLL